MYHGQDQSGYAIVNVHAFIEKACLAGLHFCFHWVRPRNAHYCIPDRDFREPDRG